MTLFLDLIQYCDMAPELKQALKGSNAHSHTLWGGIIKLEDGSYSAIVQRGGKWVQYSHDKKNLVDADIFENVFPMVLVYQYN